MKHPLNYLFMEQHSAEWYEVRCGMVTASRISDVMAFKKNGEPMAVRENYKMELLTELLTGRTAEHYVSPAMDWGITNEPLARATYELSRGVEAERIGFAVHPTIKRAGASPDALIGEDGLLEAKCPNTVTHLNYLLADVVPEEYIPQMAWQLACTGRAWCDFLSYDPRLPEDFAVFVKRYNRDDALIAKMEESTIQFIGELNALCERLKVHADAKPKSPVPASIPNAAEWIGAAGAPEG